MLQAPKNFVTEIEGGLAVVQPLTSLTFEPYGTGVRIAMREGDKLIELFLRDKQQAQQLARIVVDASEPIFTRAVEDEDAENARQGVPRPCAGIAAVSNGATVYYGDIPTSKKT